MINPIPGPTSEQVADAAREARQSLISPAKLHEQIEQNEQVMRNQGLIMLSLAEAYNRQQLMITELFDRLSGLESTVDDADLDILPQVVLDINSRVADAYTSAHDVMSKQQKALEALATIVHTHINH